MPRRRPLSFGKCHTGPAGACEQKPTVLNEGVFRRPPKGAFLSPVSALSRTSVAWDCSGGAGRPPAGAHLLSPPMRILPPLSVLPLGRFACGGAEWGSRAPAQNRAQCLFSPPAPRVRRIRFQKASRVRMTSSGVEFGRYSSKAKRKAFRQYSSVGSVTSLRNSILPPWPVST